MVGFVRASTIITVKAYTLVIITCNNRNPFLTDTLNNLVWIGCVTHKVSNAVNSVWFLVIYMIKNRFMRINIGVYVTE